MRSSNYYSVTLRSFSTDGGYTWLDPPSDPVRRDVLMAKLMFSAVPRKCWTLYENAPSRDYWTACHVTFQENLRQRSKGICDHYMHKCALDRFFSVRHIDPGTVAWWPTRCPAYHNAYKELWRNLPEDKQFAALMVIYKRLRQVRCCSVPVALSHTCWLMRDEAHTHVGS